MQPDPAPVRRRPPGPAIAAAVLGLVSAALPALFGLLALAFSGGELVGAEWLLLLVPLLLVALLPAGAVLLLLGRTWLVLTASAGALCALVVAGYASGGWGDPTFGVLTVLVPLLAAVLAALPGVRGWVAARRRGRAAPAVRARPAAPGL